MASSIASSSSASKCDFTPEILARPSEDRLVESQIEAEVRQESTLGVTFATGEVPLRLTKLLPSSCFLGKLFVGDIVLTINNEKVSNIGEFFKAARAAPRAVIRFKRDEFCTFKINKLPPPRPGTEAFEFEITWRFGGMPIGDSDKRVIVSMIETGTLAGQTLKPGDVLTKVNDTPITDKPMAKKSIVDSVRLLNRVKLTVERPSDIVVTPKPANTPTKPPPKLPNYDLPLPPDVLAILEANKAFHRQPTRNPSILRTIAATPSSTMVSALGSASSTSAPKSTSAPPTTAPRSTVSHSDGAPVEEQIEMDPSQKPLRKTPKRVGAA
ncbi:Protein MPZ-3 [Aphelenchoides avenae]|nr:Protein MPZ-3 [Aphelenchus avenae]